jgi:hypothetical protein
MRCRRARLRRTADIRRPAPIDRNQSEAVVHLRALDDRFWPIVVMICDLSTSNPLTTSTLGFSSCKRCRKAQGHRLSATMQSRPARLAA